MASYPEFDLDAELSELHEELYRDDAGFVYLLACQDSGDASYVKIGCTIKPVSRMSGLLTACPLEPRELAFCEVFRDMRMNAPFSMAHSVEQALHKALDHKRVRGEWFGLDLKSPADKAEFTAAWKAAISKHNLSPKPWQVIGFDEFRKRRRDRRSEAMNAYMLRMAVQRKERYGKAG